MPMTSVHADIHHTAFLLASIRGPPVQRSWCSTCLLGQIFCSLPHVALGQWLTCECLPLAGRGRSLCSPVWAHAHASEVCDVISMRHAFWAFGYQQPVGTYAHHPHSPSRYLLKYARFMCCCLAEVSTVICESIHATRLELLALVLMFISGTSKIFGRTLPMFVAPSSTLHSTTEQPASLR